MSPKSKAPSFKGLAPGSESASSAARGASRKRDTRCELKLRRALWHRGLRYRVDDASLPGRPDIVFPGARVAVFCDGDFWHGRDLAGRLKRLRKGHNPEYWAAKIQRNVERDRENSSALRAAGWEVLRYWERDILSDAEPIASRIERVVRSRGSAKGRRPAAH